MKIKILVLLFLQLIGNVYVWADDNPTVAPTVIIKDASGNESQGMDQHLLRQLLRQTHSL